MEKKILDKEYRDQLKGLIPFSIGSTVEFTPKTFADMNLPDELKPVFTQRVFTKQEADQVKRLIVKSVSTESVDTKLDQIDRLRDYGRKTIVGWKNIYNPETGEEVSFKACDKGGADPEYFMQLNPTILDEVVANASQISCLMPPEKVGLK